MVCLCAPLLFISRNATRMRSKMKFGMLRVFGRAARCLRIWARLRQTASFSMRVWR
jgi:hypothetical protein